MAFYPVLPVLAQEAAIIVDGRTQTQLFVNGQTTDITTKSISGGNAYNSFSKFDVESGKTVNLQVPSSVNNVVNLVHGKQTAIDGTLNSVKDGKIGGNIYILNSNGVVVGAGGKVNTGSLTIQTPTREYMDSVIDPAGAINDAAGAQIVEDPGSVPLSANGVIRVRGKVNAIKSVDLHGQDVDVSGTINVGAAAYNDSDLIRQAVNLDGLNAGTVNLRAGAQASVSGKIDARAKAGGKAGTVTVRSGGKAAINKGAAIIAKGVGAASDGGTVLIKGSEAASFDEGAVIDVRGGTSGNGGFVDISAARTVLLSGGVVKADAQNGVSGSLVIDPETIVINSGATFSASTSLLATKEVRFDQGSAPYEYVVGGGGSLFIAAPSVSVASGVTIRTEAASGARGDITILAIAASLSDSAYADKDTFLAALANDTTNYASSGAMDDLVAKTAVSYGYLNETATITVDGGAISGNNVTLRAGAAGKTVLFNPSLTLTDPPTATDSSAAGVAASVSNFLQVLGLGSVTGIRALVAMSEVTAKVEIKNNAVLTADTALKLDADAYAESSLTFSQADGLFNVGGDSAAGLSLSGVFSQALATATVDVGNTTTLNVGLADLTKDSSLAVTADTKSTVKASFELQSIGNSPLGLSALVALGQSRATATIQDGAKIGSGFKTAIKVAAATKDDYSASNKFLAVRDLDTGGIKGGGSSLIVTYADYESTARARFGAVNVDSAVADGRVRAKSLDVTAKNDVSKTSVQAETKISDDTKHFEQASFDANVGNGIGGPLLNKVLGSFARPLSKLAPSALESLSLNGAVAVQQVDMTAEALLTRGVVVAGAIKIDAKVENKVVEAFAKTEGKAQAANTGFAVSIPLSLVTATATANIGKPDGYTGDLKVDAKGALTVNSAIVFPARIDVSAQPFLDPFKQNKSTAGSSPLEQLSFLDPLWKSDIYKFLSSTTKFENAVEKFFFNQRSWATTEAKWESDGDKAKTLSMAINFDMMTLDANATSGIGADVIVNRNSSLLSGIDTTQTVSVTSATDFSFFTLNGDLSLKGPVSGASGSTSLGVAIGILDITNHSKAYVDNRAKVSSQGDIKVDAQTDSFLVTIGFSAGFDGGDVGVNGAVNVNLLDSKAEALANGHSELVSTAGAVNVTSRDTPQVLNLIGGVSQASNVGVGLGVAFNQTKSTSRAVVDGADRVSAATTLNVHAENSGFTVGSALSAQVAIGSELKDFAKKYRDKIETARVGFTNVQGAIFSTDDFLFTKFVGASRDGGMEAVNNNKNGAGSSTKGKAGKPASNPLAKSLSDATGKFGINISGDATVNVVTSSVEAILKGSGSGSTASGKDVTVTADSGLKSVAVAGAVTVKKTDPKKSGGTAGLAGSYGHNGFDGNVVKASISDIGALTADTVTVDAWNHQFILGFVASGSGQAGGGGKETANIAGSVSVNTMSGGATIAEIVNTDVTPNAVSNKTVDVTGRDEALIVSIAGGAVYSQADTGAGIGAAGTVNLVDTDTTARIKGSTIHAASDSSKVPLRVVARSKRTIGTVAAAVAVSSGKTALNLATSFTGNSLGGTILSEVVSSTVSASALTVQSVDESTIGSAAGDVSVSLGSGSAVSAGLAISVNNLANTSKARVLGSALTVPGVIFISGELTRRSVVLAAGVAASKDGLAIKGSVAVNLNGSVEGGGVGAYAAIDEDENGTDSSLDSTGGGRVTVTAKDTTEVYTFAGAVGASMNGAGVGAAVAVNKVENDVQAVVNNATVDGASSLVVKSEADVTIISGAFSGAGSGKGVAVAGAAVVNVLGADSSATVGSNARIGMTSRIGDLSITAINDTLIGSGAGALSIGPSAIGGSIAIDVYSKKTKAQLAGKTKATGDIQVKARASDASYAGVAAFAFGSSLALAGAVSIVVADNDTLAEIGGDADASKAATVDTDGNVILDAYSKSDIIRVGISAAIVSVEVLSSDTRASIGQNATVDGRGQNGATNVRTGEVTYDGLSDSDLAVNASDQNNTGKDAKRISGTVDGAYSTTKAQGGNGVGSVDPNSVVYAANTVAGQKRGVSVTADSNARLINLGIGAAGGGDAAVAAGITATVGGGSTKATIESGAKVNQDAANSGANAAQEVNIRAGSKVLSVGVGVGVAIGGDVGVGGGVDVVVGDRTTETQIGNGAKVSAKSAVTVAAASEDLSVSVAAAVGVGPGGVGVAGAIGIGVTSNKTLSHIDDNAIVKGSRVTVFAGADIKRYQIAGAGAFGGGAGVGGAIAVLVDSNVTQATIGDNAEITADYAVNVLANSKADYRTFMVAGAGGGSVGVAAAIGVKVMKSITEARVGGSKITVNGKSDNSTPADATDDYSLSVKALNDVDILTVAGGLGGGGAVGVGAAADVIVGHATTSAVIESGATVKAKGDVVVDAEVTKRIWALSVAAAVGGTVGVAGAVNVVVYGKGMSQEQRDKISSGDDSSVDGSLYSYVNDKIINSSGGVFGSSLGSTDEASSAGASSTAGMKKAETKDAFGKGNVTPDYGQTQALIGGQIESEEDIRVSADDTTKSSIQAGGFAGGQVGVGVGVTVVNIKNNTIAAVTDNAVLRSDGKVSIGATDGAKGGYSNVFTLAGAAGIVGANIVVASNTFEANTLARIGKNVEVSRLTVTSDNYDPAFVFQFSADARQKLRAKGLTNDEITAEEKVRTIAYHLEHEKLAGITYKKGDTAPAGVSQENYDLYWSLRAQEVKNPDGSKSIVYAAYDPDFVPQLTADGLAALSARSAEVATNAATAAVQAEEATITNSVKAYDTTGTNGAAPDPSTYDPSITTQAYVLYWAARNVKQTTSGNTTTTTADPFPSNYAYLYPDRATRIANDSASRKATIDSNRDALIATYKSIYDNVHTALAGTAPLTPTYDAANIDPDVSAYWRMRNYNDRVADVSVTASESNTIKSEAYGAAVGAVGIGGQFAYATKTGTVTADIVGAATAADGTSIRAGTINVKAEETGTATSKALGANGGLLGAAGVVLAQSKNDTTTSVGVGSNTTLRATGGITVEAKASPKAETSSIGVNAAAGVGLGASLGKTILTNKSLATVGDGVKIESTGDVSIAARSLKPNGADNAYAKAIAGAGGLLLGATGAETSNTVDSSASTTVGNGLLVEISDPDGITTPGLAILSRSETSGGLEATGVGVGFIGIGRVSAKNIVTNKAITTVGYGMTGSIAGTFSTKAASAEDIDLDVTSGSGGVVAGAAAYASNSINNTTKVEFLAGTAATDPLKIGTLAIEAAHDRAKAALKSDSIRASLVGASGAQATSTFVAVVGTKLGSGANFKVLNGGSILARNVVEKAQNDYTISAGSGGLIDLSSASSRTTFDNKVDLGINGAQIRVDSGDDSVLQSLSIAATNTVIANDTVKLDSGGVIANADSETHIDTVGRDRSAVSIGGGAVIDNRQGDINIQSATTTDINGKASSKTYGGAGGAGARSNSEYRVDNTITINGGSVVTAGRDLTLTAGAGNLSSLTKAYAYNKTLIPISTKPNVDVSVDANNRIVTADANTFLGARRDVTLDSSATPIVSKGYGEAEDWTKALKAILENIFRFLTGQKPKPLKDIIHAGSSTIARNVDIGAGSKIQAGANSLQNLTGLKKLGDGTYAADVQSRGVTYRVIKDVDIVKEIKDEISSLEADLAKETSATERERLRGDIETLKFRLSNEFTGLSTFVSDVIVVDNITADRGNVNIKTGTLTGTGTVKTSRRLEINVVNDSMAVLRVNDLTIQNSRSGDIFLNSIAVDPTKTTINEEIEAAGPDGPLVHVESRPPRASDPYGSDIYLDGTITNRGGKIAVTSGGSLIIGGNVAGKTVELLAAKNIIQRYRTGFTHIGGLPYVSGSSGSTIAGGNVFIAGQYININGTIQAGLPVRAVTLLAAIEGQLNEYDAAYAQFLADPTAAAVSTWSAATKTLYNDLQNGVGGATSIRLNALSDAGQPLLAFYRVDTKEVEIQKTAVGGGLVTLFGNILSTGNGQIKVTDGYGDLQVDNQTNRVLTLYGLDTGRNVEGKIRLIDTAYASANPSKAGDVLAQVTEIVRNADGKVVTSVYQRQIATDVTKVVETTPVVSESASSTRSSSYSPKAGQTYSYIRLTQNGAPECEKLGICNSVTLSQLNWFGLTWLKPFISGNLALSYAGAPKLDASKSIGVSFIGSEIGVLNVKSKSDVILAGNLANSSGLAKIESINGSILKRGEAVVSGDTIQLSAVNGRIGAEDGVGYLDINLVNNTSGGVTSAIAGQGVKLNETDGVLRFTTIKGGTGDADVKATLDVVGLTNNLVQGKSIRLEATGGSIGSDATPVKIDTGNGDTDVISAFAGKNITLVEASGDLRLDQIRAPGAVYLSVPGNLLDGNSRATDDGLTPAQRQQLWRDIGLTGQSASDSKKAAEDGIKNRNRKEYDQYWDMRGLKTVVDSNGNQTVTSQAYDAAFVFSYSADRRTALQNSGLSDAEIAADEASKTNLYHSVHGRLAAQGLDGSYDAGYTYVLTTAEQQSIDESYAWTEDELTGAINKALFSDRVDTQAFREDPNVVAGALTIVAGGTIGTVDKANNKTFRLDQGFDPASNPTQETEFYAALAAAERDDLVYIQKKSNGAIVENVGTADPNAEVIGIRVEPKQDVDVDLVKITDPNDPNYGPATSELNAQATGNIFIGSEDRDINVRAATSTNGDVRLKSRKALTDVYTDGTASVTGSDVVLEASTGDIGSVANPIDVLVRGALSARTAGSAYIRQKTGDLELDFVRVSNRVDITVDGGALLDARNDEFVNVRGRTINLVAQSIGSTAPGGDLGTGQFDAPATGPDTRLLNAKATVGAITLKDVEGDMIVGHIESPANVTLTAVVGAIAAGLPGGSGDAALNILARTVGAVTTLKARDGIGSNRTLLVDLDQLTLINSTSNNVDIADISDLIVLNARNDAPLGTLRISAAGNLTLHKDAVVKTNNGDITLLAASDGTGGDLTQALGAGRIDAGTGSLYAEAENMDLADPIIAANVSFLLRHRGQKMTFGDIKVANNARFGGGIITIGNLIHTGGPDYLKVFIDDNGAPSQLLTMNTTSPYGVLFKPFSVDTSTIHGATDNLTFSDAYFGIRSVITSNLTSIEIDQQNLNINRNYGIQIHQKPNRPLYLDLAGTIFQTDAMVTRFDRTLLTAIQDPNRVATQDTDTVIEQTGIISSLAEQEANGVLFGLLNGLLTSVIGQGTPIPGIFGPGNVNTGLTPDELEACRKGGQTPSGAPCPGSTSTPMTVSLAQ